MVASLCKCLLLNPLCVFLCVSSFWLCVQKGKGSEQSRQRVKTKEEQLWNRNYAKTFDKMSFMSQSMNPKVIYHHCLHPALFHCKINVSPIRFCLSVFYISNFELLSYHFISSHHLVDGLIIVSLHLMFTSQLPSAPTSHLHIIPLFPLNIIKTHYILACSDSYLVLPIP